MTIQEARASVGKPTGRRLCLPILGRALLATGLAIGLTPVLGAGTAHACSCEARTEAQQYRSADVVFTGTVLKSTARTVRTYTADGLAFSESSSITYVIKPTRVYKGEARPRQKVRTESGSGCGFDVRGSGPFLIFGHRPKPERDASGARQDPPKQPLRTDSCSGARRIGPSEDPSFARPPS